MVQLSSVFLVATTVLLLSPAAPAADLARQYDTVKEIARRDPKVRAAYEAADRKLADRIVEIDPTLKGYTPGRPAPAPAAKPTPKPAAKAKFTPEKPKVYHRSHVVAAGETLGGIAAKYHVSTEDLRQINDISNPKKLIVGQVLALPNSATAPKAAAPKAAAQKSSAPKTTQTAAKKKDGSWWDSLKSGL
jgi:LysM repeat protein